MTKKLGKGVGEKKRRILLGVGRLSVMAHEATLWNEEDHIILLKGKEADDKKVRLIAEVLE